MQHVYNIQYVYLLNKYLKCSVWRLALGTTYIYIYMSLGFKRLNVKLVKMVNFIMRLIKHHVIKMQAYEGVGS